jgi:hypothetical protein
VIEVAPQQTVTNCSGIVAANVGPIGGCIAMAGSIISRLPTGGSFPFQPKRGQRLSLPKSIARDSGNPVDKYGDVWEWDPVKGEWDVQTGKKHTNIGPDGEITHGDNNTGRQPMPPADDGSNTANSVAVGAGAVGTGALLWWLGKIASPLCGPAVLLCALAG